MVATTVLPNWANLDRDSITVKAVKVSRPVVGSSKKIIPGFTTISIPMAVLFLSPPEMPLDRGLPTVVF